MLSLTSIEADHVISETGIVISETGIMGLLTIDRKQKINLGAITWLL